MYGASWRTLKRRRTQAQPVDSIPLVLKVCVPSERERDYDDDRDWVQRRQSYYDAVLKEAKLYDGRLRPLQGTVVPNCYGLWKTTMPLTKETAYIMMLDRVENTIIRHSIPGGR